EPARRCPALPDEPASLELATGHAAGAAPGDAPRRRLRSAGLPRMVVAPAGDRRADAGLSAGRGAAPLARQAPHRTHRPRGRRVLEVAREKIGMDAAMNLTNQEGKKP